MANIFEQIVNGEMNADIVFQDERVTAFRDIAPKAPIHVLIVPNRVIETVDDIDDGDVELIGHMVLVARDIARQEGIAEDGYRLMINCRQHGGQEVYHLHLHLMGGQPMGPMVCR